MSLDEFDHADEPEPASPVDNVLRKEAPPALLWINDARSAHLDT